MLKDYLVGNGASLAGVADLAPFKEERFAMELELLEPYSCAVSIAVSLEDEVLDEIDDRPTPRYADHYREANARLDALAVLTVAWLEGKGYRAEAVPASQLLSEERLMGALSHKAVARMAGLGWQGKSLLLITPEHGPRVRLVTVLTDMSLDADGPIRNRCGKCSACSDACPVGAIRNVGTLDRYASRDEAVDLPVCNARTFENNAMPGIGARICGVCVRACPYGGKEGKPD